MMQLEKTQKLVQIHISKNQTSLVDLVLENYLIQYDEIKNYYDTDDDDIPDILEWWLVSEWLADKLIEDGDPVIKNGHGMWWGRTCCGQAIYMDENIQRIAGDIEE